MYESPRIDDLGSLAELTQGGLNKVGGSADKFSPTTPLVGSIVPAP